MSNSGSSIRGREPSAGNSHVMSMHRWVPTNWVSGWLLQPSTVPVVVNSFVPSDFLVEGQVSGLGTVQPLLTLNFTSTQFQPLHMKRKISSVMDGLQMVEGENTHINLLG